MKNTHKDYKLLEMFNASTLELQKSFPEQLKCLLIVSTDETLFVSPEIAKHLSKNTEKVKRLLAYQKEYMDKHRANGLSYRHFGFDDMLDIKLIALDLNYKFINYHPNCDKKMMTISVADHELGHLVVKNATASSIFTTAQEAECSADAFAAIRHVQRFGTNTDWFKAYNRSSLIVFNLSPDHYTSAVIQKIEKLTQKQDLSKLSLKETAELAKKISDDYSFSKKALERISKKFYKLGKKYKDKVDYYNPESTNRWDYLDKKEKSELLEMLTNIMLENKDDHDVYRAGKLFLERKEVQDILVELNENTLLGSNLKKMQSFERTSGIILNLAKAADNYKDSSWTQKIKIAFK